MDLHIEQRGDPNQPAVVCLHGLMGAARNLWRLVEQISNDGYFVISYDQRGHGRSAWATKYNEYTLSNFAHDALAVLDSRGVQRAHFIGHSMGGRVALEATRISPDRVRTLSLLDVGPRISPQAYQEVRKVFEPLPLVFSTKEDADSFLGVHPPGMRQFLASNLKPISAGKPSLRWCFDLAGLRSALSDNVMPNGQGIFLDQTDILKNIAVPTLVLRGQHSVHFNATEAENAGLLNESIEVIEISGAGHWLHVDNLADTAAVLIEFLKKNTSN